MTERTRMRLGAIHGFRWGPVAPEVEASLGTWLAGEFGDAEVLKPGRVWRVGDMCVKRYAPPKALGRLRRAAALRAGFLHEELLPLRTPRTLVALEGGDRTGLLITEFIEGRFLMRLWDDDPAGRAAFPAFMARMHELDIFHGDLNIRNMLWSGAEWVLIDLDGIVRGPRALARRRLIAAQWSRILGTLREREGSRELFDAYVALAAPAWDVEEFWDEVSARGRRFVIGWDEQRALRAEREQGERGAPSTGTEAREPGRGDPAS